MVLGPKKGIAVATVWTLSGVTVFFVGWPWLWFHTAVRLKGYFNTGFERTSIRTLYFGSVYRDQNAPWHYVWFYFLTTVPVGLQLLGFSALPKIIRSSRQEPLPALLFCIILTVLFLFTVKLPIYDGERLFLFVFPLWAILIGYGFAEIRERLGAHRWARVLLSLFLIAQGWGVVATYPFGLSYYNLLVGGLKGAERLGLELTYWGDPVDRVLLDQLANQANPGDTAAVVPTLHHIQGPASTTDSLASKSVRLANQEFAPEAQWIVVSRREAYWPKGFREWLGGASPSPCESAGGFGSRESGRARTSTETERSCGVTVAVA